MSVPRWVLALLISSLGVQLAWRSFQHPAAETTAQLPPPPGVQALRLASFGEPEAASRLAMVHLQSYRNPDYPRLIGWLDSILELDPESSYPLFAAARVYAETADAANSRLALEFVYRRFFDDPNRRWPWLAHAALLAKHRLKDLALARRYAQTLQRHATAPAVPAWAKQMEIFILEDLNELEAAKILIASLLRGGLLTDPAEIRYLTEKLEELQQR